MATDPRLSEYEPNDLFIPRKSIDDFCLPPGVDENPDLIPIPGGWMLPKGLIGKGQDREPDKASE